MNYLRDAIGNKVNEASCNNLLSQYATRILDGVKIGRLEMAIDDLSVEIA